MVYRELSAASSFLFILILCLTGNAAALYIPSASQGGICYTTAEGVQTSGGSQNDYHCGKICGSGSEPWKGYLGAAVAIVFFGSNFIPVKKFDTGDGFFFQWVLCIGIWLVGLVVNLIRYQPPMFLPSLLGGGLLWTTGNILTVSIIKMIGLTMGLTVWGTTNLLGGWITAMFILDQASQIQCLWLNYGGILFVIASTVMQAFVKTEGKALSERGAPSLLAGSTIQERLAARKSDRTTADSKEKLIFSTDVKGKDVKVKDVKEDSNSDDHSWVDKLGVWPRRILGFALACMVGTFYGFSFLPIQLMKLCDDPYHSCNDLDYLFGHFTGILLFSTVWFVLYAIFNQNKPRVYPKAIIPGLISGIMWGIAMVGFFVANQHLSLGASMPLCSAGPGFVSSAWGILVYREIKGKRNIGLYFFAFLISVCGMAMNAVSKCTIGC
ncbi:hypothetical protein EMCRGX_G033915 [Ephydatia muelleri]|eukprot:Em0022g331a